jgi:hypothetical protein
MGSLGLDVLDAGFGRRWRGSCAQIEQRHRLLTGFRQIDGQPADQQIAGQRDDRCGCRSGDEPFLGRSGP